MEAVPATLLWPGPARPSGQSLAVRDPHRHGDLGEFFPNAVLHDAPQVEAIVWLVWYPRSLFLLGLFQLMLVLSAKTKPFNHSQRTENPVFISFPSPMLKNKQTKKTVLSVSLSTL